MRSHTGTAPTLAQAGIDKKLSARAQKLAAVPEPDFEGMLGEWRDRVAQEGERVTTRLLNAAVEKGEITVREAAQAMRFQFAALIAATPPA